MTLQGESVEPRESLNKKQLYITKTSFQLYSLVSQQRGDFHLDASPGEQLFVVSNNLTPIFAVLLYYYSFTLIPSQMIYMCVCV